MGTDMGEEINNKMYFKDEDGNMQEIGSTEGLKIEPLIEDEAIPTGENIIGHELTGSISVSLEKNNIIRFKKMLGYNILKPKRFKKLLMSIGFDRNEAEWINETFEFFGKHRYECFINGYKDLVPGIKLVIKDAKKEAR